MIPLTSFDNFTELIHDFVVLQRRLGQVESSYISHECLEIMMIDWIDVKADPLPTRSHRPKSHKIGDS